MQLLYDALRDMLPNENRRLYLKGIIQIAPLAFMRGRTLDNAFVILMRHKIQPILNENVFDSYG